MGRIGWRYVALLWVALLTGCASTTAQFTCADGASGSLTTTRLFLAVEASAPVCGGQATVSSDPSAGAAVVGQLVGALVRLSAGEPR